MKSTDKLARRITKEGSLQTYYIILFLSDRSLVNDAFKAYAYFRWLDDQIDKNLKTLKQRITLIKRQKEIIDLSYKNIRIHTRFPEENLITDLIKNDTSPNSLLKSYIYNFFKVMEFDAKRKGKIVTGTELKWYSDTIGVAVTDCISYFIDKNKYINCHPFPYRAATAAHIIHTLRDFKEDIQAGFINIPKERVNIDPNKFYPADNTELKIWIKERVSLAKTYFKEGKIYISSLGSIRRKIAAYLYCLRFESIIKSIEKNNYNLQ